MEIGYHMMSTSLIIFLTCSYFSLPEIIDTTRVYVTELLLLQRKGIATGCLNFLVQNSRKSGLWEGKVAD